MCLAIPGQLLDRADGPSGLPLGRVRFGSVVKEVCLAFAPEARPGDYLVVHVGFAIQILDEDAARRALALFDEEAGA